MACIDPRAVVALKRPPGALNHPSEHRRYAREQLARGRDGRIADSLSRSVDIEIRSDSCAARRAIR
jgi:hypothetical protein